MTDKHTSNEIDALYDAFLSLETKEECMYFFDDLFTPVEVRSFAQRLEVAKLLSRGVTFLEIENLTGASSATIARISRCVSKGNGYKTVLERI